MQKLKKAKLKNQINSKTKNIRWRIFSNELPVRKATTPSSSQIIQISNKFRSGTQPPRLKKRRRGNFMLQFQFGFQNLKVARISTPGQEPARLCHSGGEWIQERYETEDEVVELQKQNPKLK